MTWWLPAHDAPCAAMRKALVVVPDDDIDDPRARRAAYYTAVIPPPVYLSHDFDSVAVQWERARRRAFGEVECSPSPE